MAGNPTIQNQIRRRKELFGARIKRPKRNLVWLFPDSVDKLYRKILLSLVVEIERLTKQIISPHISSLVAETVATQKDRMDTPAEEAERLFANLNFQVSKETEKVVSAMGRDIGQKTSKWNDAQWRKIMKHTLGVELFVNEPWLIDTISSFTAQNVLLIKSLSDDTINNIQGTIQRGMQNGMRPESIEKQLYGIDKGVFKKAKTRARLIARDQVSKLNGNLQRLRQGSVGIKEYVWQTSDDERVRATHSANDGKTFQWDKPPIGTGHPSWDINCRCWADPVFPDDFFNNLKE